ncbi:MAG: hypothetical protein ACPG5P_00960, partial [Saprospiraceae bacterium]
MNRFFPCFLFFLLGFSLFSQENPFLRWTTGSELPKNNISSIKQDHQGFIWLENEEGITRFDGVEFRNYEWDELPTIDKAFRLSNIIGGRDNRIIGLRQGKPYSFSPDCKITKIGKTSQTKKSFFFHHTTSSG